MATWEDIANEVVPFPVAEIERRSVLVNGFRAREAREELIYWKFIQKINLSAAKNNPSEQWMSKQLLTTGLLWTRQAMFKIYAKKTDADFVGSGYRFFDFWCHQKGIRVEVDGSSHDTTEAKERDAWTDAVLFKRHAIITLRVRNLDEAGAAQALQLIETASTWNERRQLMGLKLTSAPGFR